MSFDSTNLPTLTGDIRKDEESVRKSILDLLDKINSSNLSIPTGLICSYGGSIAPPGWAMCDGGLSSRTSDSSLFAIIGTTFGSGDGVTTFNRPDLRETSPVGAGIRGSGVTAHDAAVLGQFKDDQFQGHHTSIYRGAGGGSRPFWNVDSSSVYSETTPNTGTTYGIVGGSPISDGPNGPPRTGTVTRGKILGVNYIIKR